MVCLEVSEPQTLPPPAPQFLQFQVARASGGGFTLVPDGIDVILPGFARQGLTPPAGFYLSGSPGGPLVIAGLAPGVSPGPDQIFNVDFLQGDCWFSLYYTTDQDYFAGVNGIDSWGRPAIAGMGWTNDPTQIWRAEVVTSAAVAGDDTPAAVAAPNPQKAG